MKQIVWYSVFIFFISCSGNNRGTNDADSAKKINDSISKRDKNTSYANSNVDRYTIDFAAEAANGNITEIELGKYAQEKAVNQRVKNFGAMMINDHTLANEELKTKASSKNIALPSESSESKKMIDRLDKKHDEEFDKAYIAMMVEDHKKDIAKFMEAAEKCPDTSIRKFAVQSLPVLQKHLDSAKAIAATLK